MDGIGTYTSVWKVVPVNVHTWQGADALPGIKKIKIVNSSTDSVPKIQSGSMTVVLPPGDTFNNGWYRIQMIVTDAIGNTELTDVATLLFEQLSGENNYDTEVVSVNGQSVLKPVEDRYMKYGRYVSKGENGAKWCANIISECTPAPVVLDDDKGFTINRYFVFDGNTSCLKAVWKILDSAGWVIQIDGDGTIHLLKKPTTFKMEIGRQNLKFIKPGIKYNQDISDVPNVYYAKMNKESAQAENNDPDSITSVKRRTYIKNVIEYDPVPIDGETLDHYVNRRLEEESTIYKTYEYTREYGFDVKVFDNVYWNIPTVHTGMMRVLTQTLVCEQGITIEESCGEEIKLWQMGN